MNRDDHTRLTMNAMASAVAGDADRACDALDQLGDTGDPFHMYAACCAFAEVGTRAMRLVTGETPDLARGDMWALQELKPGGMDVSPAKTFAVRFLVAYANDDRDTVPALYRAALEAGPEAFTESVCELLLNAADLHRLATSSQP
ncbi:hypothetical protein ACIGD1_11430 [Streptomyces sp. NPDC085612]|uniref:hypothetical protein n=1 Tax=Streptomyces sp. NPDC085612 TaxID=3365732 RepID=UPI0037D706C9